MNRDRDRDREFIIEPRLLGEKIEMRVRISPSIKN
jgi:hypothetical protein